MNILTKYKLPLWQAEAEAAAATPEPEPVPAPVESAPEPEAEPAPEPEHGNKGKQPWFLGRISEESAKRSAAEDRALQAERRAQEAEAMLRRMQDSGQSVPQPQQAPAQSQPQNQDFDRAVDLKANEKIFYQETLAVKNAGLQKFGQQFENNLNMLTAVGATNNDVVSDILAVDRQNAHVILNKLAGDLEKAATLAKMDTRTRIAELTRMQMAETQPVKEQVKEPPKQPARQVSRAPAPPPPVEPSATKIVNWRTDEASDEDFTRGFNEMMEKRSVRR